VVPPGGLVGDIERNQQTAPKISRELIFMGKRIALWAKQTIEYEFIARLNWQNSSLAECQR
jgi:hypothetical protein